MEKTYSWASRGLRPARPEDFILQKHGNLNVFIIVHCHLPAYVEWQQPEKEGEKRNSFSRKHCPHIRRFPDSNSFSESAPQLSHCGMKITID
jgi:hypothetical protein